MSRKFQTLKAQLSDLFSDEEDPNEPVYDPVHLGAVFILSLASMGGLFWLLWTLLVFEGGLVTKIFATYEVLLTSKTLADVGYLGTPYAMGAFEGWLGNVISLFLIILLIAALHRLYWDAHKKSKHGK